MSRKQTYKGEIVEEYLKKFPKASTIALARMLKKDYPIDFKKLENARSMVRQYRNEIPSKLKTVDVSAYERTDIEKKQFIRKKFELPESDYEIIQPFIIPNDNILVLCDIHLPYQDNKALELAIEYGIKHKVNGIYLNGDVLDLYQISRFIRDRRKRHIPDELEMCRNFLAMLKKTFNCPIYYKFGNHEERWENFLKLNAPELFGMSEFELSTILRFGEYNVQEIKSRQLAYAGKLAILHGHEFGHSVFSPVNPARGLYLRAKDSSVIGHHHQTSEHSEKSLNGEVVTTWSVGCLCGLQPEYMPYNKWNHGFMHVRVKKEGFYEVDNIRIINGKIV